MVAAVTDDVPDAVHIKLASAIFQLSRGFSLACLPFDWPGLVNSPGMPQL